MNPLNKLIAVPASYLGVWRRSLLEQNGSQDTTSLVFWLQADNQHIDIRIPALRPDFSDCTCLQDCSTEQLRWLATQQGFAGVTEVSGNICNWHRELDLQPDNGVPDIGEMVFSGENKLLETGVESVYFEVWDKIAGTHINVSTHQINSLDSNGVVVIARLLKAGNQFAFIRPRSSNLPEASSLLALIDSPNQSLLDILNWLDFEISFGDIVDASHGRINHSTLPFREGQILNFSLV